MIFKRKIYNQILEWKKRNGKTALLVQGARRVGKSTIVEEFAKKEYKSYITVDFSKVSNEEKTLFEDISDLNFIFSRLQFMHDVKLFPRESLIIFDEVQLCPKARQAIKHLVKDGRYDYIETGSLLSIKQNVRDILIPSEETRATMHPMDFEEFCWAIGKDSTPDLIRAYVQRLKPFGEVAHRKLLQIFRQYMLVGGMPQAVMEYIKTNNFVEVEEVKKQIISLYEEDFRKLGKNAVTLFREIPSQLSANVRRYQVGSISSNKRASRVEEEICDMTDSKVVNAVYAVTDPNIGLASNVDFSRFKMFTSDIGIFISLAFRDVATAENEIYKKIISGDLTANLGYVFECMASQILQTLNRETYFYSKYNEETKHTYEIDFLITKDSKITPIEVKSGSNSSSHKSLDNFIEKYRSRINEAYVVHTKDVKLGGIIKYIPIYAMPFVFEKK